MSDAFLEQFSQDIHQQILAKAGIDFEDQSSAQPLREEMFTETVLELLEAHDAIDDWELCTYQAKSSGSVPAAKLSGWSLSADGVTLDLYVSLYFGTGKPEVVGKPEVRRHFELALGFLWRGLRGYHTKMEEASTAFHAAKSVHEVRDTLSTVRLFFLTDGIARQLEIERPDLPGLELRYEAWDLEKLSQLKVGERAPLEFAFQSEYGVEIPCIESTAVNDEYRTFLSFFPATTLAKMYGLHGLRLLERNVRAFLQVKGKVNKGLQKTLKDEPGRFLAYNNGLCCTAAEVKIKPGADGLSVLAWAKDFQIVNGGQTTASIFHAIKKEGLSLSDVSVQVKLTVLSDPEQVAEMVPLISRYANSQNKVNGADFAANGAFHRKMEEHSRTVWAPAHSGLERGSRWYYERARGSYLDDKARQGTPARQRDWSVQNPANQRFSKTDLAKYEHAWLGLPHLVCRGAEKNFEAFASRLEDDGEPEVDQQFFQDAIARVILWKSAEKSFNGLNLEGYRANSVAYGIAWLAEHTNRGIDLDRIWREQSVPTDLATSLSDTVKAAHEFLVDRAGNVSESSKKPATWDAFRGRSIDVELAFERPVVQRSYPEKKSSEAALSAKDAIANVSSERWFRLSKWSKERGFLEGWERSLAFSLGRLAAQNKPPSDKQAVQGARIWARALELGFSETGQDGG